MFNSRNKFAGMPGMGMGMGMGMGQPDWRATLGQPMGGPMQQTPQAPMQQPTLHGQGPRPAGAMMPGTMTAQQIAQVNAGAPTWASQYFSQGDPMQQAPMGVPPDQTAGSPMVQPNTPMGQPGAPMYQPGMLTQRMMDPAALQQWQDEQAMALRERQAAQQQTATNPQQLQMRQEYATQAQAQRMALQNQQAARLQAMQQRQGTNVGPAERARMEEMMRRMAMQRRQLRGQLQQNRPGMLGA